MDVPSTDNQSIEGCGLPDAEQSNHPPDEFENSSFGGGSITKAGPRRWESKALLKSEKKKKVISQDFHPTTCYFIIKKKNFIFICCYSIFYITFGPHVILPVR